MNFRFHNDLLRFDPWSLLNGFKRKALALGVKYIHGDVSGFDCSSQSRNLNLGPNSVTYTTPEGHLETLEFSQCVIATGYESGRVAALAGIGTGDGLLGHPLPVEPKFVADLPIIP